MKTLRHYYGACVLLQGMDTFCRKRKKMTNFISHLDHGNLSLTWKWLQKCKEWVQQEIYTWFAMETSGLLAMADFTVG